MAEVAAGEVVGEMSLLTGELRSADARAVDEVELIEVRKADMKELLDTNEGLAHALADEIGQRLEQRADALADLTADAKGPATQASLLSRIRRFFDLG